MMVVAMTTMTVMNSQVRRYHKSLRRDLLPPLLHKYCSLQADSSGKLYRVGHEKVGRLPFCTWPCYCINFCIYAMLRTRATFSWPNLYVCVCVCVCQRRILHVEKISVKRDIHHRYSVSFEARWECHCDEKNSALNIKTTGTRKFTFGNETNAGTAEGFRMNHFFFHVCYFLISFVISQATTWIYKTNFH